MITAFHNNIVSIVLQSSVLCCFCIHFGNAQAIDLPAPLPEPVPVAEKVEVREVDTLGNWYNLGRVSGNKTYTNALVTYFDKDFALIDAYHFSSGNSRIETGMTALSLFGASGSSGGFLVMLPSIDITAAPSPENRFSAIISTSNLYIAAAGVVHAGFEDPLNFVNSYQWDFLSRRGAIHVNPDQYENSFHFGPQLNAGQVRARIGINHSITIEQRQYPKFFTANSYLTMGILDNLSFSGSCFYKHIKDYDNRGIDHVYYYDPWNSYLATIDSLYLSGSFQLRTPSGTASLGYSHDRPQVAWGENY